MKPLPPKVFSNKLLVHPATLNNLVNDSWDFAHAILWNGRHFNGYEVKLILQHIRTHYLKVTLQRLAHALAYYFNCFCQRILLAKETYRNRFAYRSHHPCIWFSPSNTDGYLSTLKLWERTNYKRF